MKTSSKAVAALFVLGLAAFGTTVVTGYKAGTPFQVLPCNTSNPRQLYSIENEGTFSEIRIGRGKDPDPTDVIDSAGGGAGTTPHVWSLDKTQNSKDEADCGCNRLQSSAMSHPTTYRPLMVDEDTLQNYTSIWHIAISRGLCAVTVPAVSDHEESHSWLVPAEPEALGRLPWSMTLLSFANKSIHMHFLSDH